MTTVLDPLGTPTIIYNRSGKNIQSFVANSGSLFSNAVQIPAISEETFVFIDGSGGVGQGAVWLDSAFEIGDTVTIKYSGGTNVTVYDSSGGFVNIVSNNPMTLIWKDPITNNWSQIG